MGGHGGHGGCLLAPQAHAEHLSPSEALCPHTHLPPHPPTGDPGSGLPTWHQEQSGAGGQGPRTRAQSPPAAPGPPREGSSCGTLGESGFWAMAVAPSGVLRVQRLATKLSLPCRAGGAGRYSGARDSAAQGLHCPPRLSGPWGEGTSWDPPCRRGAEASQVWVRTHGPCISKRSHGYHRIPGAPGSPRLQPPGTPGSPSAAHLPPAWRARGTTRALEPRLLHMVGGGLTLT